MLKQAAIQETDEFTENRQQAYGEEKDERGVGGTSQEPQAEFNPTRHCDAVESMKGFQAFPLSRNSSVV
jgi:hypothetical protein